ncbi:hypothetical protein V1634_26755 [Plantactinospora veratri]|uniref:Uncharacterized protein n=1 Tax=Plantactinospora veratri TaxID=1436122 RepID=A0ABU7SKH8_9ACTN
MRQKLRLRDGCGARGGCLRAAQPLPQHAGLVDLPHDGRRRRPGGRRANSITFANAPTGHAPNPDLIQIAAPIG